MGIFLFVLLAIIQHVHYSDAGINNLASKPIMGWTSWDLCAIKNSNIYGPLWLNSTNILTQSNALVAFQPFGYNYLNIDSFWANDPNHVVDEYGRYTVNTQRFPQGMQPIIDHVHNNKQKIGLYINPGLPKAAYNQNTPVKGSNTCRAKDIVLYPLREGNVFQNSYQLNYSNPCATLYVQSFADMFAEWGIDFLKIDAVSPGSWSLTPDCRPDIQAWAESLVKTDRPIWLELSWSLNVNYVDFWRKYANGWRIESDVDCYCSTLVSWASIYRLFNSALSFIPYGAPGGWNDFDALVVGNEDKLVGLNQYERQTAATLWAISNAQWYMGGDMTCYDDYGKKLLTNVEVIEVNQNGLPAKPLETDVGKNVQTWYGKNNDGSMKLAGFNLDSVTRDISVDFSEIGLMNGQLAQVRDLWNQRDVGNVSHVSVTLPSHASFLYKLTVIK
eukprot:TRINITY_DN7333_c0_g1_i2.p1 TRINITY_DN7333_c0_g1~~TRINITY_DN7333_c0_g1_i2.p1  ORF type:complete len:444 (-),score=58.23 TRINITY_DN7333_c0_g1_i2:118-1449(-)